MAIIRHQFEHENDLPVNTRLLYVSSSRYEKDWPSRPHSHPFTELFYITGGTGNFLVEDSIYPVKKDDLVIINANLTHTEKSSADSSLEYIALAAEGVSFSFPENRDFLITDCPSGEQPDFFALFQAILNEVEKHEADFEFMCQKLFEILMILIRRRQNLTISSIPTVKISRECYHIKRYLDTHYSEPVTLETLAELTHLNKYYLSHAFSRHFGYSPMAYLCRVRINAARELLTDTSLSISEIAYHTGFSSQSYFSQAFQKYCRITPSLYRKTGAVHNDI